VRCNRFEPPSANTLATAKSRRAKVAVPGHTCGTKSRRDPFFAALALFWSGVILTLPAGYDMLGYAFDVIQAIICYLQCIHHSGRLFWACYFAAAPAGNRCFPHPSADWLLFFPCIIRRRSCHARRTGVPRQRPSSIKPSRFSPASR
jgi:hypothetical protein